MNIQELFLFFMILGVLFFTSCSILLGLTEPKKESVPNIYRFYTKKNIDTTMVVFMEPLSVDTLMVSEVTYKPGLRSGFQPIQFRLYDAEGRILSHYISCEGPLKMFDVLDQYPPINILPLDSSNTIQGDLNLVDVDVKSISLKPGTTIFIYSQLWTGAIGSKITKKVIRYAQKHKVANIYVFNTDMR